MSAALTIAWGSFAEVTVVTLVTAVVPVALFAFARARPAPAGSTGAEAARRPGALGSAVVCFVAVAAIVIYGLYLVVHK